MKRKYFYFAICAFALSLILIFCLWVQESEAITNVRFTVSCAGCQEEILLHEEDGIYYAFLPSYANHENTSIRADGGDTIYIDGRKWENGSSIAGLKFGDEYTVAIKNFLGVPVNNEVLVVLKSANIPAMSIQIIDGELFEIDGDKSVEKNGTVAIITEDGTINYSGSFSSMQSRGNASWYYAKKPYKLAFDIDTNLLELGANKEWVLLANSYDASNLKNKIVFETARKLGVRFVSNSAFVDLYVNGEYRGLYLLTEKLEVGVDSVNINNLEADTQAVNYKSLSSYDMLDIDEDLNGVKRIRAYDIPNDPDDISGGYILKSEMESRITEDSYFVTEDGYVFACESPKYATAEQMRYVSNLFSNLVNSMGNYEALAQIIDIESFIDRYLIHECFANYEASSNYFIKDSDAVDAKICAEPVWDFDAAWGAAKTVNPIGLYAYDDFTGKIIYSDPVLLERAQEAFFVRMLPLLQDLIDELPEYANYISDSDRMNKIRWKSIFGEDNAQNDLAASLTDYLEQRTAFLREYWTDTSKYAVLTFVDTGYFYTDAIETGTCIEEVAAQEKDGYTFLGWYDRKTGEILDPAEPIYENREYAPKWEADTPAAAEGFCARRLLDAVKKDVANDPGKYIAFVGMAALMILLVVWMVKEFSAKKTRRNRNGRKS